MKFTQSILRITLLIAIFATSCTKRQVYEPQSYEELSGHTICALEGSAQQDIINHKLTDIEFNAIYFTNVTDCMLAVRNGKADMFFGSDIQAYNESFKDQYLKICHYVTITILYFALASLLTWALNLLMKYI